MTSTGIPGRSNEGSRRAWARALAVLAACLLSLACGRTGPRIEGHLLQGKSPTHSRNLVREGRLTDGAVSREGDHWDTDVTAVFKSPTASAEWDLGRPTHLTAAYVQGDNNDEFIVLGSDDGVRYRPIWTAPSTSGAGMRARYVSNLDATVRWVKLTARGGDLAVSASEFAVFEQAPAVWPPPFRYLRGRRPLVPGELETLAFGIVTSLLLLLHRRSAPIWERLVVVLTPVGLGAYVAWKVWTGWPPPQPIIDALRAISAAVGAAAVLRIALRPRDVMPRFLNGTLAAMALLALTTFFNMWQPQFEYAEGRRNTWVHTWDMRVYFPTAKYFDELGFDGLYLASVAAYLEDAPGASAARIADVELRDLRDYDMTTVDDVIDQVYAVKYRFSPERWLAFKKDMSFFWRAMGAGGYLGSLRDHGGNATPAWLLLTHAMFRNVVATEPALLAAAALDPLLLVLFFVVAWRTFGVRTALVAMIAYGSSTFPWFGSNWAGSTLRNDWMVLVGLGACALRKERHLLGGVLLAGGAMIRAFPALSVMFLVAPALVAAFEGVRARATRPTLRELVERNRPLLVALLGATVCVVVLVGVSGAFFGFEHSWVEWAKKISMHSVKPNVNHVGLRTLFQYDPSKTLRALGATGGDWSVEQVQTFLHRRPLYVLTVGLFTLLALAAARGRDLRQAALIGMMMIPIYFYPSNYYLHYVFVLPLLVDETEEPRGRMLWGLISVVVLGICVSEYWGFADIGVDERYVQWSVGAIVGYVMIFAALFRDAWPPLTPAAVAVETAPAPAEPDAPEPDGAAAPEAPAG